MRYFFKKGKIIKRQKHTLKKTGQTDFFPAC